MRLLKVKMTPTAFSCDVPEGEWCVIYGRWMLVLVHRRGRKWRGVFVGLDISPCIGFLGNYIRVM